MSEPIIVPPTPEVTQSTHPGNDDSPGLDQVQSVFDRILPPSKNDPLPTQSAQPAEIPPAQPVPSPPETPPDPAAAGRKTPSFLEEALKVETGAAPPAEAPPVDEWPEEQPSFKSSEESRARYKKWRESYNTLKEENKRLSTRSAPDPQSLERVKFLENQNREMSVTLSRLGVEQSAEFQNQVIRPLYGAWNEAARIVKEAGGDPQALAQAMQMRGKAQFEALDELFQDIPESAKVEAHDALRAFRRYDEMRRQALSNAPQTLEALQKEELKRQYASVNQQREEMKNIFENQFHRLRDEAKLEVFQTSTDPDAAWWNEQAKEIENNSRKLYLENTDMDKMAVACLLAPAVDAYRKLWLSERAARLKVETSLNDKFGTEPNLTESSGGKDSTPSAQLQEDLKKPFSDVFLREFHKSQQRNR